MHKVYTLDFTRSIAHNADARLRLAMRTCGSDRASCASSKTAMLAVNKRGVGKIVFVVEVSRNERGSRERGTMRRGLSRRILS